MTKTVVNAEIHSSWCGIDGEFGGGRPGGEMVNSEDVEVKYMYINK